MPYNSTRELPDQVTKSLPEHAQHIYIEAYNNAYEEYKNSEERRRNDDRETVAHKVAWAAVKRSYEKGEDNKWRPKKSE